MNPLIWCIGKCIIVIQTLNRHGFKQQEMIISVAIFDKAFNAFRGYAKAGRIKKASRHSKCGKTSSITLYDLD